MQEVISVLELARCCLLPLKCFFLFSDDDLVAYDMSHDKPVTKVKTPVYIRDCMEGKGICSSCLRHHYHCLCCFWGNISCIVHSQFSLVLSTIKICVLRGGWVCMCVCFGKRIYYFKPSPIAFHFHGLIMWSTASLTTCWDSVLYNPPYNYSVKDKISMQL